MLYAEEEDYTERKLMKLLLAVGFNSLFSEREMQSKVGLVI